MMRKSLLAALIAATSLVPAIASAQDWHGHGDHGQSNGQSRSNNGGGQRPQWNGGQRGAQAPAAAPQAPQAQPAQAPQQYQRRYGGGYQPQAQAPQAYQGRQWRGQGYNGGAPVQQAPQQYRSQQYGGQQYPQQYRGGGQYRGDQYRGGSGYRGGYENRSGGQWNNGWRNEGRYDWRDYRNQNRNLYRLPRYYAPRGYDYGYRRFSIGAALGSWFYAPQYWIDDPFYYRLPPAYGPYRWVRYYNDALLVDIETGEVVDTIYDIFW